MSLEGLVFGSLYLGASVAFVTLVGWLRGPPPERKEEGKPSRGGRGRPPPPQAVPFTAEDYNKMVASEDWIGLANIMAELKQVAEGADEFMKFALLQAGMLHNCGEDGQAVGIYNEILLVLAMLPSPHGQFLLIASMVASIGQLEEAEKIVLQVLKPGMDDNNDLNDVVYAQNCLANMWASTNRMENAKELMEKIRKSIGRTNAPKAWSRHLVTLESEFVVEDGKVYCKITFQRNGGMSTDPPAKKTSVFPSGFTLRCSFENPESGRAPFSKAYTMPKEGKVFSIKHEYPIIKKKAYLVEVEVFEDAETPEGSGHHLVLCQSEIEK